MEKGKRCVVDGTNLWNMARVNGISTINYRELYKMLLEEIGTLRSFSKKPQFILNPRGETIKKHIIAAGFQVTVKTTNKEEDDNYIRDRIANIDPEECGELVLVTSDILDQAEPLREKAEAGIKIYILATETSDKDGGSMLSSQAKEILTADGFYFFDLADFKERVMLKAWEEKGEMERGTAVKTRPHLRNINIQFEVPADSGSVRSIMMSFANLLASHQELKGTIEVK